MNKDVKEERYKYGEEDTRSTGSRGVILAVGVAVLAAAVLAGCFFLKGCGGKKTDNTTMQSVFADYLEENDKGELGGLSKKDRDRIIAVSIDALERQIGNGKGNYDRQELITEVEKAIQELGLGLSEETVRQLAEAFVDLYTTSFYEVYNDNERASLTIKQMNDDVTSAMRENLSAIMDYLTQLDSKIVGNQSSLDSVIWSNTELGDKIQQNTTEMQNIREQIVNELETMEKQYSRLIEKYDGISGQLNSFFEIYVANTQQISEGLVTVQGSIDAVREQLSNTDKYIQNTLTSIENNNVERQESINEQFIGVRESISETRALIRDVQKSISDALQEMNEKAEKDHEEMLSALQSVEEQVIQTLNDDMAIIEADFANLNASITASINAKSEEIKAQLSDSLAEIELSFTQVNQRFDAAESQFDAYLEQYHNDNQAITETLQDISSSIDETKAQILQTERSIQDTLDEMESNNVMRQEVILEKMGAMQAAIEATQRSLSETEQRLTDILADMSKEMKTDHAELVSLIKSLQNDMTQMISENIAQVKQQISALQDQTTSGFAALQESLDSGVATLSSRMDGIHSQITTTQDSIMDLLRSMDQKNALQCEEIMDAIEDSVDEITQEVNIAYNNLQALIRLLNADMAEQHRDTLDALEKMEDNMGDSLTVNFDGINKSFSDLDMKLSEFFNQMKQEQGNTQDVLDTVVGELGDNLKENQQTIRDELAAHDAANKQGQSDILNAIRDHNSNTLNGQTALQSAINGHDAAIKALLEQIRSSVEEKFNSVFTSVSSGKKLLASALLTKGVTCDEDATFAEIRDAILGIAQTIDVGGMPGSIEYEYHYHVDGNGGKTGSTQHLDTPGGCYTQAVYHTHGNSCYAWHHEHDSHCKSHPVWVDWVPGVEPYWGAIYDCGDQPANVKGKLTCELPSSEDGPIYYELGCGLSDGQIVAAHIVYEGARAANARTTRVIAPPDIAIQAVSTVNESAYPERIEGSEGLAESEVPSEETEMESESETETKSEGIEETDVPVEEMTDIPEPSEPQTMDPKETETMLESETEMPNLRESTMETLEEAFKIETAPETEAETGSLTEP